MEPLTNVELDKDGLGYRYRGNHVSGFRTREQALAHAEVFTAFTEGRRIDDDRLAALRATWTDDTPKEQRMEQEQAVTAPAAQPPLRWGAFWVGTTATAIVAALLGWATNASWGHWWFGSIGLASLVAVVAFAASSVMALFDRKAVNR